MSNEQAPRTARIRTPAYGVDIGSSAYEAIVTELRDRVNHFADDLGIEAMTVPPIISRSVVERAGYVRSFPHLLGTVHAFQGTPADWSHVSSQLGGSDWHRAQTITDVVLLPASCYHIYPILSKQELQEAASFAVHGTCFRQESTSEPGRLRSFRMSELVYLATPKACRQWRDFWLRKSAEFLRELGIPIVIEIADDPFFGPGERLMSNFQRDQELKWEVSAELAPGITQPIVSANCHLDHFGTAFEIRMAGDAVHSACVAFGLDRIALAILHNRRNNFSH